MSDSSVIGADSTLAAEVLWCVQHIEATLAHGKLGEKKAKLARVSRNLLKNPDTPLIKVRQIMRNSCGDYRLKMRTEEMETKLEHEKISTGEIRGTKSNFIKKASKSCDKSEKLEFKFNFNHQSSEVNSDIQQEKVEMLKSLSPAVVKSENVEFKFNFNPPT